MLFFFCNTKQNNKTSNICIKREAVAPAIVLPAGEVHLIATQVDVGVGEHGADLLEERFHEVICGVQNGVDGSKAPGGGWPRVARCEQVLLA